MINVWCVRAEFGTYAKQFAEGGYVAIGWMGEVDLSTISSREELYPLYKQAHPDDKSNIVIGQQVGPDRPFPAGDPRGRLRDHSGRGQPSGCTMAR